MGTRGTAHQPRGRYDAARVRVPYDLNGLFPYLMKGRNESAVYFPIDVDAEPLLAYIAEHKGTDQEVTLFQAFMLAAVKVLRARPTLNRYIIGRRVYQRRDIVLGFTARKSMTDDGQESEVLLTIKPEDDRAAILAKLKGEIAAAKGTAQKADEKIFGFFMRLPRSVLRLAVWLFERWDFYVDTPKFLRGIDPLRCSVYVANLGSIQLDAPYHHLYEWGTCPLFVTIGQIKPQVVVGEDGRPTVKRIMPLRCTLDERTADGYYDARSLDLFNEFISHPASLEEV